MRRIPFYSEDEPDQLAWQRAAVSASSALEKRNEGFFDAAVWYAKRGYWSGRWMLNNPSRCADVVGAQFRVAVARSAGQIVQLDGVNVRLASHYPLRLACELLARTYASSERKLVRGALEDDDMVMEIGAGIGVIASLCALRLGSHRVVTFEAHPAMARSARDTFALNGISPRLEHCALRRSTAERTQQANGTPELSGTDQPPREHAHSRTLREAVRQHRPTFLIIDERGECELIKEAIELGVPKVLIAFHPTMSGAHTVCRAQFAFARAGYVPVSESADGNRVLYRRAEAAPTITGPASPDEV